MSNDSSHSVPVTHARADILPDNRAYSYYWVREVIDFPWSRGAGHLVTVDVPWDGQPLLLEFRKIYDGDTQWNYNKRTGGWSGFVLIELGEAGLVAHEMTTMEAVTWWLQRHT